jgi:hypothetical protein
MWLLILNFCRGILLSGVLLSAVSVYIFHDVDKELIGKWNIAFRGLLGELFLFGFFVALGTAVLTQLGRLIGNLRPAVPSPKLGFIVGIGVILAQYPVEYLIRKIALERYGFGLDLYIILSMVIPSAVFIEACRRQKRSIALVPDSSPT